MTLYSHNNKWPTPIPHRITLSNGKVRTDRTTFTENEISDAGYIRIDHPVPNVEYPNKLDWDSTNMQWVIRAPNEYEIANQWEYIRSECVRRLEETDYKVIKALEAGVQVDPAYVTYRQELRDLYNNVNDIDPWNVSFPVLVTPTANTA